MSVDQDHVEARGFSSLFYWENRYRSGGNSGFGSRGRLATYKADVINRLVAERGIRTVVDFGCGDGHQIGLLDLECYTGLDVSDAALELCLSLFRDRSGWRFFPIRDREAWSDRYDMAMSLDVIFHLVEPAVFDAYMRDLFAHVKKLVVIYSSDADFAAPAEHVLHRCVSAWVAENAREWKLTERPENPFARVLDAPHERRTTVAQFMLFEPVSALRLSSHSAVQEP